MRFVTSLCAACALGLLLIVGLGCEHHYHDGGHHGEYRDRVQYHDDFGSHRHHGHRGRHHRHDRHWDRHDGRHHDGGHHRWN